MKIYNVMQYGAKGDGKTNDAFSIQHAVDDCAKSGLKIMLTSISKRVRPLRPQAILTDISGQTSLSMTLKRRL